MKVTALRLQQRNKTRVNVYLDGKFAFGLAKIVAARLAVGQDLDEAALERLRALDDVEQAYERALKFLGPRPRSESEVRRRLKERGVAAASIDEVVTRLKQSGLVNDQAFASYWVENRASFRPRSKRVLQAELKQKGVSDELLRQALDQTNDVEAARALALVRARRLHGLEYQEFRRKLGDFLARRGFDFDLIGPLVDQVWTELEGQAPEND